MLTFELFSFQNQRRADRWHGGFPYDGIWVGSDWSNAMAGEAGEACNIVKKLRRIDTGLIGKLDKPKDQLIEALAEEIADVITYADLLATFYGIDLEKAIRDKFNKVSELQGFPERL